MGNLCRAFSFTCRLVNQVPESRIPLPVLTVVDPPSLSGRRKVRLISLGCPKNQVDSERLLGSLQPSTIVASVDEADTIVINTCGFIESAKAESIDTILAAVRHKELAARRGIRKEIIVTGCLSERYREELLKELPEVDAFFGVKEYDRVLRRIEGHEQKRFVDRRLLNEKHFAYLKISEGCNQQCSFCYIPMIRGRLVSRPIEENIDEARRLVDRGVRELILISQDTSSYGYDLHRNAGRLRRNADLIELLERLADISDLRWIRVMYLYPSLFSDALVETLSANPKVCKYVDLPLQHISDPILKSMRRNTSTKQIVSLIEKLRERIPNVALRTSFIVGYPGETDREFEELCSFVRETRFERLGVFTYSPEEGTHAYGLLNRIESKMAAQRHDRLMQIQQGISLERNLERIGQTVEVLIDRTEEGVYVGRTMHDAPEIDNEVMVRSARRLEPGQFVHARITDAVEYDLYAECDTSQSSILDESCL